MDCSVLRIFVFTTVGVKRVPLAHCTPQSCPIFVYREAGTPLLCSRGFLYEQKNRTGTGQPYQNLSEKILGERLFLYS